MTSARAFRRCLAALLVALCALHGACPAAAAALWRSDADGLTRIDTTSGDVRALAGFPRADTIEPDVDGGAWIRVGAEVIRVEPDLALTLRVGLDPAPSTRAPMVWDPAARQLWIAAGASVLRFGPGLALEASWPQESAVRGIAVGGPRAIWVATETTLVRFDARGAPMSAIDLATLGVHAPVDGLLFDPLRDALWVVTGVEAIRLRAGGDTGARERIALPAGARAVAVDPQSGDLLVRAGARWLRAETVARSRATGDDEAIRGAPSGAIRLGRGPGLPSLALAVAGAVELGVRRDGDDRSLLRMPRQPIEPAIGASGVEGDPATGARVWIEPVVRCGEAPCGDVEGWLAGVATVASVRSAARPSSNSSLARCSTTRSTRWR